MAFAPVIIIKYFRLPSFISSIWWCPVDSWPFRPLSSKRKIPLWLPPLVGIAFSEPWCCSQPLQLDIYQYPGLAKLDMPSFSRWSLRSSFVSLCYFKPLSWSGRFKFVKQRWILDSTKSFIMTLLGSLFSELWTVQPCWLSFHQYLGSLRRFLPYFALKL